MSFFTFWLIFNSIFVIQEEFISIATSFYCTIHIEMRTNWGDLLAKTGTEAHFTSCSYYYSANVCLFFEFITVGGVGMLVGTKQGWYDIQCIS